MIQWEEQWLFKSLLQSVQTVPVKSAVRNTSMKSYNLVSNQTAGFDLPCADYLARERRGSHDYSIVPLLLGRGRHATYDWQYTIQTESALNAVTQTTVLFDSPEVCAQ